MGCDHTRSRWLHAPPWLLVSTVWDISDRHTAMSERGRPQRRVHPRWLSTGGMGSSWRSAMSGCVAEMLDQDQHGIAGHDTSRRSCIFVQEQRKGRRVPVGWGLSWLAINGGYGNPLGEARKEEREEEACDPCGGVVLVSCTWSHCRLRSTSRVLHGRQLNRRGRELSRGIYTHRPSALETYVV